MKEKILIALSDQSLASLLSTALSKEGYTVVAAKTGEETLQKLQSEMPALLLVDLVLPGKNGYDVLTEKSLDRLITKIPTIIVSNTGSTVEMRRIPATPSMVGYIIKTHVDPAEVLQKVSALFNHPYVQSVTPAPVASSTPAPKINTKVIGKKILWVEDDKFLSSILFKKFESSGHIVLKASNGEEALKLIEAETPDVIVLDIMLPGMDGFEILQKIKMNEKFRNIPAIMLSNLNKPTDIEKAKTLGAQKFLVKAAVSLDEIRREVDNLLQL